MRTKLRMVTVAKRVLAAALCAIIAMGMAPAASFAEEVEGIELEELQDDLELGEEPQEGEPEEEETEELVLPGASAEGEVLPLSDEQDVELIVDGAKKGAATPTVRYHVHVQTYGDQAELCDLRQSAIQRFNLSAHVRCRAQGRLDPAITAANK